MEELIYNKTFAEWETELSTEFTKSAESFVRIGYLLKVARDTDILKDSGYANINEYAKDKYNIDKTLVSRFININDKFSMGGNSPELKEQYKGFGYAKLAIMLSLPEAINEELTPDYTKSEINAIKSELDEERKTSDLEIWAEGEDEATKDMDMLTRVLIKMFTDYKDPYSQVYEIVNNPTYEEYRDPAGALFKIFASMGEAYYSIHIQGIGRIAVLFHRADVSITNMRTGEKEKYFSTQFKDEVFKLMETEEDVDVHWEKLTGLKWNKNTEVAPVQPKKESRVQIAPESTHEDVVQCTTEDESNDNVVSDTTEANVESESTAADVEKDNAGSEDNAENEAVAAVAEDDNVESEGETEHSDVAAVVEESLKNDAITSAHNIANVLIGATELNGDIMDWAIKESLALTRKLCELQDMEGLPE